MFWFSERSFISRSLAAKYTCNNITVQFTGQKTKVKHYPKYSPSASVLAQGGQIFYNTVLKHRAAQLRLANMAVNGR